MTKAGFPASIFRHLKLELLTQFPALNDEKYTYFWKIENFSVRLNIPGMTGPPNSFTARGPVTLTAILFTQPAV